MEQKTWLRILTPDTGKAFSSFDLYLPAGGAHYTQYRFAYQENPPKPELAFHQGPNVPANQKIYRIHEAYVVKKEGDSFRPLFRVLKNTIPDAKTNSFLCIRFMFHALDNKIYFRTCSAVSIPRGSRWQADTCYRITYCCP